MLKLCYIWLLNTPTDRIFKLLNSDNPSSFLLHCLGKKPNVPSNPLTRKHTPFLTVKKTPPKQFNLRDPSIERAKTRWLNLRVTRLKLFRDLKCQSESNFGPVDRWEIEGYKNSIGQILNAFGVLQMALSVILDCCHVTLANAPE